MERKRVCKVCGKVCGDGPHDYTSGMCLKHYCQFKRYGKCLDNNPRTINDENEVRIKDGYAEVDTYDASFNVNYTYKIDIDNVNLLKGKKWRTLKGLTFKEPHLVSGTKSLIHFHELVVGHNKAKVRYLNGDTTDLRRENIEDISNEGASEYTNSNNKFGIRGVNQGRDGYAASLCIKGKTFGITGLKRLEEAVYLRMKMEADYDIVLKKNDALIKDYIDRLNTEDRERLDHLYLAKKDIYINGYTSNYEEIKKYKEEIEKYYYKDRIGVRKISKIYGISYSSMMEYMIKMGFEIRKPNDTKEFVKDDEQLKELFNKCISIKEISEIMGVCHNAIERRIKELKLVRPKSMMSRDQYDDTNDEEIIRLYQEGKSSTEIGEILGVSHRTILAHLEHCNIQTRTLSESQFNYYGKEFPEELKNYETLYDMYVVQKMSKKDISETLNVCTQVIDRVLKNFDIHVRGCGEARIGLYTGPNHPNWKGGRSGLYMRIREYFRWSQAKAAIKRDGKKCQLCGETRHLQVHHIRHFKDIFEEILSEHPELDLKINEEELYNIMINDPRMNDMDNLITYCKECHLFKVHGYKHKEDK